MERPTVLAAFQNILKGEDPPIRALALRSNSSVRRLLSLNSYFQDDAMPEKGVIKQRAERLITDRIMDDFDSGLRSLREASVTNDPRTFQAALKRFVSHCVTQACTEHQRPFFSSGADAPPRRNISMTTSTHQRLPQPSIAPSPDVATMLISPGISDLIGQACQEVAPRYGVDPSAELVAAVRDALRYRREFPALYLRLAAALTDIHRLMADQCEATIAGSLQGEVACESILPYVSRNVTPPAATATTPHSFEATNPAIGSLGFPCSWESGVTH